MTESRTGDDGKEATGAAPLPACLGIRSHFRRLVEIERALAELGPLFRESGQELAADETPGDAALARYVGRVRVAGFFAYCMAREGLELVRLTAAAAALERATPSAGGATPPAELEQVLHHAEQIGPLFDQTLREMEPYRELDAAQTLEMLATRRGEGQR